MLPLSLLCEKRNLVGHTHRHPTHRARFLVSLEVSTVVPCWSPVQTEIRVGAAGRGALFKARSYALHMFCVLCFREIVKLTQCGLLPTKEPGRQESVPESGKLILFENEQGKRFYTSHACALHSSILLPPSPLLRWIDSIVFSLSFFRSFLS